MARYDEELLQIHQEDALRAAEKHRMLKAIAPPHAHNLRFEFGHLLVRLGLWFEGIYAAEEETLTFQRRLHAH